MGRLRNRWILLTGLTVCAVAGVARAADEGGGHVDAFSFVLFELASVILIAGISKSLGVLEGSVFSALVMVVILSTVVSPPLLKWAVAREPA